MASETSNAGTALADTTSKVQAYLHDQHSPKARRDAIAAAKALVRELQNGEDAHFAQYETITSAYILRTVVSMGIMQAMPESGSISADELAKKMNSSTELIIRFMRMLVASGVFAEPSPQNYAHTEWSRVYLDPGHAAWHDIMMMDCSSAIWAKLGDYYATHDKVSPTDMKSNPLTFAFGMEGQDWHMIYARSPEKLHQFVLGMGSTVGFVPVFGAYPYGEQLLDKSKQAESEGSVFMVDIGGSDGSITKAICATHPELSGPVVVQDQQRVIDSIKSGFLPNNFTATSTDFWQPQPVKAKVYFLRRVLHDWPDEACALILRNQAAAMEQDSIVLISETVVPEKTQSTDTYPYWMDMIMLPFAGKERTASDWEQLLEASGLELVKIWTPEVGFQCMIEGRLKR